MPFTLFNVVVVCLGGISVWLVATIATKRVIRRMARRSPSSNLNDGPSGAIRQNVIGNAVGGTIAGMVVLVLGFFVTGWLKDNFPNADKRGLPKSPQPKENSEPPKRTPTPPPERKDSSPPKRPDLRPPTPRVETFSGYMVPDTKQYVKVLCYGFPRGVDDDSLAYYLREHLGAHPQTTDDFQATLVLRLEASETLDVPGPGCNNEVMITIEYHFEDLSGTRLASEPFGSGKGHHCTNQDLVQAEKYATGAAIADVKTAILIKHP